MDHGMANRPDFILIGAMKSATSTLHQQLAAQPGIFMTSLKEPNFFSNDEIYARGVDWYQELFKEAQPGDLRGESSTHYTKLPTYPHTIQRIQTHLPDVKLIYMMRHPIDRLVSHYIHEWSQRVISVDINQAIDHHPELIAYSCYSMQLQPYLAAYGSTSILPIFFERFCEDPQAELLRIAQFMDYPGEPIWYPELGQANASRDRLRKSEWRDFLVNQPVLQTLRRRLVPKSIRAQIRRWWTFQSKPELRSEQLQRLEEVFDHDLAILGSWLGTELSCQTFKEIVCREPLNWAEGIHLQKS